MCSYFQIGSFFLLLFFPFSLTLTNTCNSYFPVENSITNTSFLTHTLSIPQILTTDGYTPGIGYVFTIETRNNAVINTFLFQVQNQDSAPVGTFIRDKPSQSLITCLNPNDTLTDANLSADRNLTYLSVPWLPPISLTQLTDTLSLVYTLGISSTEYRNFNSEVFSIKDFCSPSPCENGICQRLLTGGYSCMCPINYFGSNCQHFNACASSPCLNMGSCTDQLFGFDCACPPGYIGRQCEVNIDECTTLDEDPCMFNGVCIDGSDSFSCECYIGYTGERCEINFDDCTAEICNAGVCVDLVDDYTCVCPNGTAGRNCEISHGCPISENLCLNNGVCSKNSTTGEISCGCHSGFTGPTCGTSIDHCIAERCENGGTCHHRIDTYLCECATGWEGIICDINVNECQTEGICNDGICVDVIGSFDCFCSNGFAGSFCESNIPDCFDNDCAEFSTCEDGIAEYTCVCPPGRTGVLCDINVDLCVSDPCRNNASCTDGVFSHSCTCNPGYTGDNCEVELDECDDIPCLNNGSCVDRVNSFECVCRDGYTGLCCEVNINECDPFPCQNNGDCIDQVNGFTCDCSSSFTGITCEEDVDECATGICLNNSTCSNSHGGFTCTCEPGFTGELCGSDINECLTQPCLNGGSCVNTQGNFTCACPSSYKGNTCQTFVPSCSNYDQEGNSLDCENNGTCIEGDNFVTCQCIPGYTGTFCENEFDPCLDALCGPNSTCIPTGSTYFCVCPPGITGPNCNTDVMECQNNICQNNASCMELYGSYRCICGDLFSGQMCEIPLNICEISRPCSNNGTCDTTQLGTPLYNCTCPSGYSGNNCEIQIDYCQSNLCFNNATCVSATPPIFNQTPLFTCICMPGYTGAVCSEDIDECQFAPCKNNGTCLNVPGSYSCQCAAGYTGATCGEEILECEVLKPCQNNATCIEMIGRYICECPAGYTGVNCSERIDFCLDLPCNNGSCVNLEDGYMCMCPQGVTGTNCTTDIPECASQPCMNNGTCHESYGSFSCVCPPGLTGTFCEEVTNNCSPAPCINGGICQDSVDGFLCFCPNGYTGNICNIDINDCISMPCLNGGTCIDGVATFSCVCTDWYTGPTCSVDLDSCLPGICSTNGVCIDIEDGYVCNCSAGYTGTNCEVEINECENRNCSGNGECFPKLAEYDCLCNTGYSGSDCEVELDMCLSDPCQNNGICVDEFPFFECNCVSGYTGELCQTDIDECANNPCRNEGTCIDLPNDFFCLCPDQYTGPNCETEVMECTSSPCLNNGSCQEVIGAGFICTCLPGYTGDICENKIDSCELYPNICGNGTCINILDRFFCNCDPGFTGTRCETLLNTTNCLPNSCYNGSCVERPAGFDCNCYQGYEGERCEFETNECVTSEGTNQCLNGSCMNLIGDFYCSCFSGYTGRRCEVMLNACVPDPCQNGVCRTAQGQLVCLCYEGYSGDLCEVTDCPFVCENNGSCVGGACMCRQGYTGQYCETYIPTCDANSCMNGGECIEDVVEGFRCLCTEGVTGRTCDMIISFCKENSCLNGGTCVDVDNGFECDCPIGYTGQRCESIFDSCATMPCSNNATCISAGRGFSCSCKGDYMGSLCQYYNNCVGFDCNNGMCVNLLNTTSKPITSPITNGLVACVCKSGYTGELCDSPVDTCNQNDFVCSNRGTCVSREGGAYSCECDLGYAGKDCQTEISSVYFAESSYLEFQSIPNHLNQYTIDMSIQTNDSSALLLYTAQDVSLNTEYFDFLLVQIISGQLRVTFDCGSGPGTAQTNFNIDDGETHTISIVREAQSIKLTVDDREYTGVSAGDHTQQTLTLPLSVGGVSNYSILPQRFTQLNGYTGCVHSVTVSSEMLSLTRDYTIAVGLETCQESSCGYIQCRNEAHCSDDVDAFFKCNCPQGYRGTFCDVLSTSCRSVVGTEALDNNDTELVCLNGGVCKQIGSTFMCTCVLGYSGDSCQQVAHTDTPYFSGEDSYLILTFNSSFLTLLFDISLHIRPLAADGVVFYSSQYTAPPVGDYALLQLINGHVQFIFDCGSGSLTLTSAEALVLNSWHRVRAMRVGRVGHLFVDSQQVQTGSTPGILARINLDDNLYLGGFDSKVLTLPSTVITSNSGFIGCIEEFNSYSDSIPLSQATGGLSVNACPAFQCNDSYCYNDGICLENVSVVRTEVSCSCQQGYSGDRCQNVIDVCLTENRCQAGGICRSTGEGNYLCSCPLGRAGFNCEEEFTPILPKLTTSHSFIQYPLLPHNSPALWNKIEFSFTFDFSITPDTQSTLWNVLYFGSYDSEDFMAILLDFSDNFPTLQLQYDIGSGVHTVTGPTIQQDVLYTVRLTRYAQQFTLTTQSDTTPATSLESRNEGTKVQLNIPMYPGVIVVGALSQQLQSRISSTANISAVRGCLHTLKVNLFEYRVSTSAVNGLSISDCLQDICFNSEPCLNGGACIQHEYTSLVCLCGLSYLGDNCGQAITISTASFLSYSSLSLPPIPGPISEKLIISLPIKLDTLSGRLLLAANKLETEFIRLELIEGVLVLNSHLGDAIAIQPLLPSRWYNLTVVITRQKILALVDGTLYFGNLTQAQFITTETMDLFIVGSTALSQQSFQGCIGNITLSYDDVTTILPHSAATEGHGISQCVFSQQCSSSVCSHHGVCSLREDLSYSCDCHEGYGGDTCDIYELECDNAVIGCINGGSCKVELVEGVQEFGCVCLLPYTGEKCQYKSTFTSAYFNKDSYLGFPPTFLSGFQSSTVIELLVVPESADGVLLFAENLQGTTRQDYIYIGLRNYKVEFRFDLGTGSITLVSRYSIQLGKPVSIRALRNEQSGQLLINDKLEASGDSPGSSTFFAVNMDIYLGGVPFDQLVTPFGSSQGFGGCIGSFQVGYQTSTIPVSFTSATSGIDIRQCGT